MKSVQITKNVEITDCTQPATVKLERVRFFNRQLLTAEDMITERDYFLQKLRRHNRFLHGWGVVCGLNVTAAAIADATLRVQIGSGYALGPYGDEIFVGESVFFDLANCLKGGVTNPCEPTMILPGEGGRATTVYLAIKYAECLARPIQVAPSGCGCDSDPCQYSRIRDSFQIGCAPPPSQLPPVVTLCQIVRGVPAPCPPCPDNPWVILAKINIPGSSNMHITNSDIDNTVRRVILSTAVLQDQIVRCCCGPTPSSSSSSSVSSSSSSAIPGTPDLVIGQNATQTANRATQISVTVTNDSGVVAKDVVVTVALTYNPDRHTLFKVVAASGWVGSDSSGLKSEPFTLQAFKSMTLTFIIEPAQAEAPSTALTSYATARPSAGVFTPVWHSLKTTIGG